MKIALIGPGIMPIPPSGWGAVEILIWDYYSELTNRGHEVEIINTPSQNSIIKQVNEGKFDFVHLHYDVFFSILDKFICPKIAITSHYPYIDQIEKHATDGYRPIFNFLLNQNKYYNFVLANKDLSFLMKNGANPKYLNKINNFIDSSMFQYIEKPIYDKTIYLGKITPRKNQSKYQKIPNIDFVGDCIDHYFNTNTPNYKGEWTREHIYNNLTNYSNLILISEGEADPLVVKEALVAGLGVVINRKSAENIDSSLEFITIIEDENIDDLEFIKIKIEENREIAVLIRDKIRDYGISNFDIKIGVDNYLKIIETL